MDELKKVLLDAGVSEDQINSAIAYLELVKVEDLRFYKSLEDYEAAGIKSKIAQRNLVSIAEKLNTEHEAEKAATIEAKRTQASIEVTRAAAEENAKAAMEQRAVAEAEASVPVLVDAYKDEDAWIRDLQQKGIVEFDVETYIAGIKALLAANIGVFEAIPKLMQMVNDYAVRNAKPAPSLFYDLQMILTKRYYGLVVAATDDSNYKGVPIYATEEDMLDLFKRMREDLVPSILNAARAVARWYGAYSSQSMNDYFTHQVRGSVSSTNYPSPAPIDEAGKALRISINRVLSGNGTQKALAIRNEYKTFIRVLNDPALPQSVGAVDRDGVLAQLGFDADAAAIRSEIFIINFVINVIKADDYKKGKDELRFYTELYGLANQIDWSGLSGDASDADLIKRCMSSTVNPAQVGLPGMSRATIPTMAQHSISVNRMDGQEALMRVGAGMNTDRDC